MTFEEYQLRIPNIKSIEKKVNSIIEQLKNVKSKEEELKVIYRYFKWTDKISSDITVIQIRNSINTLDPVYEKAMEKINEISHLATEQFAGFDKFVSRHHGEITE